MNLRRLRGRIRRRQQIERFERSELVMFILLVIVIVGISVAAIAHEPWEPQWVAMVAEVDFVTGNTVVPPIIIREKPFDTLSECGDFLIDQGPQPVKDGKALVFLCHKIGGGPEKTT